MRLGTLALLSLLAFWATLPAADEGPLAVSLAYNRPDRRYGEQIFELEATFNRPLSFADVTITIAGGSGSGLNDVVAAAMSPTADPSVFRYARAVAVGDDGTFMITLVAREAGRDAVPLVPASNLFTVDAGLGGGRETALGGGASVIDEGEASPEAQRLERIYPRPAPAVPGVSYNYSSFSAGGVTYTQGPGFTYIVESYPYYVSCPPVGCSPDCRNEHHHHHRHSREGSDRESVPAPGRASSSSGLPMRNVPIPMAPPEKVTRAARPVDPTVYSQPDTLPATPPQDRWETRSRDGRVRRPGATSGS